MRLAFFSSPADSLSPLRGLPLISFAKKNQEKPLGQGYWDRNVLSKFYIFHYSNVVNFWSFFSLFLSFVHQNRAVNHSWSVWIDISLAKEAPFQPSIYIYRSDFVKTWPLGFRLLPGASRLQTSALPKKVEGAWCLGRHSWIAQGLP